MCLERIYKKTQCQYQGSLVMTDLSLRPKGAATSFMLQKRHIGCNAYIPEEKKFMPLCAEPKKL